MSLLNRPDGHDDGAARASAPLRYDGAGFHEFGLSGDDLAAFFGDCQRADGASGDPAAAGWAAS